MQISAIHEEKATHIFTRLVVTAAAAGRRNGDDGGGNRAAFQPLDSSISPPAVALRELRGNSCRPGAQEAAGWTRKHGKEFSFPSKGAPSFFFHFFRIEFVTRTFFEVIFPSPLSKNNASSNDAALLADDEDVEDDDDGRDSASVTEQREKEHAARSDDDGDDAIFSIARLGSLPTSTFSSFSFFSFFSSVFLPLLCRQSLGERPCLRVARPRVLRHGQLRKERRAL